MLAAIILTLPPSAHCFQMLSSPCGMIVALVVALKLIDLVVAYFAFVAIRATCTSAFQMATAFVSATSFAAALLAHERSELRLRPNDRPPPILLVLLLVLLLVGRIGLGAARGRRANRTSRRPGKPLHHHEGSGDRVGEEGEVVAAPDNDVYYRKHQADQSHEHVRPRAASYDAIHVTHEQPGG